MRSAPASLLPPKRCCKHRYKHKQRHARPPCNDPSKQRPMPWLTRLINDPSFAPHFIPRFICTVVFLLGNIGTARHGTSQEGGQATLTAVRTCQV